MPELPDQNPESWNKTSRDYDKNILGLMEPFIEEIVQRVEPSSNHKVLDVAAGSGAVTMALASKVDSVKATDFASSMLEILKEKAKAEGLGNVETQVMDGQDLKLEDETFDRVCSNFGIIFFPDRVKGFAEMKRVLKPGGKAIVTGWCGPDKFEAFGLFMGSVKKALPEMPPPPAPPPIFSLADSNLFEKEMKEAGFSDVKLETVSHKFEMESGEAFWELFRSSAPPAVALLKKVGPEATAKIRGVVLDAIKERFGSGPVVLMNAAHIAVGVR